MTIKTVEISEHDYYCLGDVAQWLD